MVTVPGTLPSTPTLSAVNEAGVLTSLGVVRSDSLQCHVWLTLPSRKE